MTKTETTQRAIDAYNRARQAESEADALRLAIERQGGETADALARAEVLDCGHEPTKKDGCGTGYGYNDSGKTFCYTCAAEIDRETMRNSVKWTGYVTIEPLAKGSDLDSATITNWPGSLKISGLAKTSKHGGGFGAKRVDVWFTAEGSRWHGVNRGDNQILRCTRIGGR